ncbi:hypothetical protein GOV11_03060 [Candidatus Woesearchaeota archaeon]|nr:hypothetical protein [Candidatus Woesearchaeota archaeon]
MRHTHHVSNIVIIGFLFLFVTLILLFSLDSHISGLVTTRVNITASDPANCTIYAGAGYNTVSFQCINIGVQRSSIVNGSGLWAMYQYVPGTSDQWKVHNPTLPAYVVSDLAFLSRRIGYVMLMNSSRVYSASGLTPAYTDIPFIAGWNLLGYPSLNSSNATTEFASISGSMTQVRTYNNTAGIWLYYNNPGGTLNYTVPGQGYWLNGTASDSWRVFR